MKPNFTFRHPELTQNPSEPQKKFEDPRFSWPTVEGPTEDTERTEGPQISQMEQKDEPVSAAKDRKDQQRLTTSEI